VKKTTIALFASGSGSNALNLYNTYKNHPTICIGHLICNRADALVINRFKGSDVPITIVSKPVFNNCSQLLRLLNGVDIIVLAGFLWLIPECLIEAFPNRIINLHPSLLPKYGGKGMYGLNVHNAVIEAKEAESGITVHLVNKEYDKGKILFQTKCKIEAGDTPELLAKKINALEMAFLPEAVTSYITELNA